MDNHSMSYEMKLLTCTVFILALYPHTGKALPLNLAEYLSTANNNSLEKVPQDSVSLVKKSPTGAMLRSLFVPGWGQLYNGKWFKAILVCGTEVGLLANAVYQNQMAVQATLRDEREWYQNNRNLSVWWLLATVLLSMADAYVDAHLYGFDESKDLSLRINPHRFDRQKDTIPVISISMTL